MHLKIAPGLNVERNRRRMDHMIHEAPSEEHRAYLRYILDLFNQSVESGRPSPVSEFLPMYEEEFGL